MHLYIRMNPGHPLGFPFWVNLSRSRGDLIGQLGKRRIFFPKEFSAHGFLMVGGLRGSLGMIWRISWSLQYLQFYSVPY
jgi:hypothetical protein